MMQFYSHASPEDMRLRFFMSQRAVPNSQLARFTQIDYDREMSFIALESDSDGKTTMVGEVRALCDPDNFQADFAIMVAANWQDKGLGRILLKKMIDYLRTRGTAELVGQCLAENAGMKALAQGFGFTIIARPVSGVQTLSLALGPHPAANSP
jgi:acetyltransferase